MARCPNCSAKLGCSCKLRKAADGKQCCVNCVTQINKVFKEKQKRASNQPSTAPGPLINVTAVPKK